jgi:2-C-methyl-D-erythritol 4-phosphate cytidylyltransferase
MNNIYGVILAGGSGSRMKTSTPKQFMKIRGFSLLEHSVKKFKAWGFFKSIVIVSNPDFILETEKILANLLGPNDRIVEGGFTRHESSLNGINSISYDDNDVILLHDSARPYFLNSELHEIANSAVMYGVSSVSENATDTVVISNHSKVESILNRDSIYFIKTPQGIHTSILKNLLNEKKQDQTPTDLCSWAKTIGVEAYLVHSNPFNMKVTREGDLEIAEKYYDLFLKLENS